jgi:gliding motility-associated-like protein
VEVDSVFCFGETGRIELKNLRGGKTPYQISFDGGKTFGTSLVAANLKEGTYDVVVKDASGCVNTRKFILDELPELIIRLGNDFFLNIGEDTLLSIKGQYDELTAKSVTWKANGDEISSAKNSSEILVKPDEDTEYTVTVVDKDGCEDSDNVFINIRRVKPECVPNIFTPNDLDGNNYFSINCVEVERVTKYSIYDRWGNLMFTGKDLSPDQPQTFWDGKFKGQPVVPGVYIFYIELLFKDGSTEKRGGDVTVLR